MNKFLFIKSFIALIFIAVLSACGTTPFTQQQQPTVIYNTKLKPVPIPNYLLTNCPIPLPPNREAYLALSYEQKEEVLTSYSIELHKAVQLCNSVIDSTRDWNDKQLLLFKDYNK